MNKPMYWIEEAGTYRCPKCDTHYKDSLPYVVYGAGEVPNYCPHCGQRLQEKILGGDIHELQGSD